MCAPSITLPADPLGVASICENAPLFLTSPINAPLSHADTKKECANDAKEDCPDHKVCERYCVSPMTLWRWDRDPQLNFPKAIRIRGRKYRDQGELDAFDATRERDATSTRDGNCRSYPRK